MTEYTTPDEQVEHGLDEIDPDRTIEVNLRDLVYVYKALGELRRFFHQPLHYPNLGAVNKFLGNNQKGAYNLIRECYYRRLYEVWPQDISEGLTEGGLYPSDPPDYLDPHYADESDPR